MATLEDKKSLIFEMLALHPSLNWYRQCLEMNTTAEELVELETDPEFLRNVESILFLEKQKLMSARKDAITLAASKGGWQGYDKLLQEVDRELFSVSKDIKLAGDPMGKPVNIVMAGKGSGNSDSGKSDS